MHPDPETAKTVAKLGTTIVSKTLEKLLEDSFAELRASIKSIREEVGDLRTEVRASIEGLRKEVEALGNETRAGFARLDQRLDGTTLRIDSMNERLEARIDGLAAQQSRIFEEVATLKRDQGTTTDLLHRMARIEDRVFSSAN